MLGWFCGVIVYSIGDEGKATITGSHGTGTVCISHHLRGYDALIRTADGQTIGTGFADDDYNASPSTTRDGLLGKGGEFSMVYFKGFPADFIIVTEADSPWATSLRCYRLAKTRSQAEAKAQFAPDVAAYRDAANAADEDEKEAGCDSGN